MSRRDLPSVTANFDRDRNGFHVFKFVSAVMKSDKEEVEKLLTRLARWRFRIRMRVTTSYRELRGFVHEMTPAMFVLETGHWDFLPILARHGYDPHQHQRSSRYRSNQMRASFQYSHPFERLWVEGDHDYESVLEYFFASIFEKLGEWRHSSLQFEGKYYQLEHYRLLSEVDRLLAQGLDVHKMDAVSIFDQLGISLMYNLKHNYAEDEPYFPDFPPDVAPHLVELNVIESLFRHGFADFEKLTSLDVRTNWIDILVHLVTHPRIRKFCLEKDEQETLPEILQTAARLLINIIVSGPHEHVDKLWVRAYFGHVNFQLCFSRYNPIVRSIQMFCLMGECTSMVTSPPSLLLLARSEIRKCLMGGDDFKRKVDALGLPELLADFVIYIGPEHIPLIHILPYLASLAKGRLEPSQLVDVCDLKNDGELANTPPVHLRIDGANRYYRQLFLRSKS